MSPSNLDLSRYRLEPIPASPPPEPEVGDFAEFWGSRPNGWLYVALFVVVLNPIGIIIAKLANNISYLTPTSLLLMIATAWLHHYHEKCHHQKVLRDAWLQEVNDLNARSANEAIMTAESLRALLKGARDARTGLFVALDQGSASLDRATREHRERAYGPFWDAVEEAVSDLGRFQAGVRKIAKAAQDYSQGLRGRQHNFPPFPYLKEDIPAATELLNRLSQVVRRGQTDYEFASIWEQRKTRETIRTGFGSLEAAVRRVGATVATAMQEAQLTLQSEFARVNETSFRSSTAVTEAIGDASRDLIEASERQRKELREILERRS